MDAEASVGGDSGSSVPMAQDLADEGAQQGPNVPVAFCSQQPSSEK
jgi:hypothetical protein